MSWVKTNHVKRALREGRPTAGAWLTMCSAISAEITSRSGFDWLLIDMEHGHGDYQTLLAQLQAVEGSDDHPGGAGPGERPGGHQAGAGHRRLRRDGALGRRAGPRWRRPSAPPSTRPPASAASPGATGPAGYGRHTAEYWKRANDEILVVIQIETPAAVAEIEEIVQGAGRRRALHRSRRPVHRARPHGRLRASRRGGRHDAGGDGRPGRRARARQHHARLGPGARALRQGLPVPHAGRRHRARGRRGARRSSRGSSRTSGRESRSRRRDRPAGGRPIRPVRSRRADHPRAPAASRRSIRRTRRPRSARSSPGRRSCGARRSPRRW